MASIFDRVRANNPRVSVFDLSQEKKLSCKFGTLVPIYLQDVIPGDRFNVTTEMLVRLQPLTAPVMHRVDVNTHYFFVPNRLVWSGWEDFITGGRLGTDTTVPPQVSFAGDSALTLANLVPGSLSDFMGLPICPESAPGGMTISELPFRAYNLIYNEYYRDQNLETPIDIDKEISGVRAVTQTIIDNLFTLRNRCWERDYFTSALPWTQRGAPVTVPLGGFAPVQYVAGEQPLVRKTSDGSFAGSSLGLKVAASTGVLQNNADNNVYIDPNGSLEVDLEQATSTTINNLREAFQLQKWLERNARAGSRYVEQILAHFGVISPDARLQRPEFLGGGKSPILISEVPQMSSTDQTSPQATLAGKAVSVQNNHAFNQRFTEHGFVIGIMSIKPRTTYQQGLSRMFTRTDKLDYFWPEFANLGEQEVKKRELYFNWGDTTGDNEAPFGYQSRYAEYRYNPSTVHGDFKTSLDFWHMGRVFNETPALNADFVHVDTATSDKAFAVQDAAEDKVLVQLVNNVRAIRPIPKVAEPGFIDH